MATTKKAGKQKLPGRFEDLVRLMPPKAIVDDVQHENTVEMVDRLMRSGPLTKGQSAYLETLVQLVQVYEAAHHAIEVDDLSGLELLKYLLDENEMSASDLARILDVHSSMGSKILKGDRSLTIDHVRRLAERFNVDPTAFIR